MVRTYYALFFVFMVGFININENRNAFVVLFVCLFASLLLQITCASTTCNPYEPSDLCLLMQVLSLKDDLNEAKREIQRLLERSSASSTADNVSSNSPSSSLTIDYHQANNVIDPRLLGEQFGMGGCFDNMFYLGNNSGYAPCMEWGANQLSLYDM